MNWSVLSLLLLHRVRISILSPCTALIYATPKELPGERGMVSLCLLQGKIRSEGEAEKELVMFSSEDSQTIPSHGSVGWEVNQLLLFSGPFSSFLLSALQGNAMKTIFPLETHEVLVPTLWEAEIKGCVGITLSPGKQALRRERQYLGLQKED